MTYRQDWDNAPQEIRTFYSNFCHVFTGLCAPFWWPAYGSKVHFNIPFLGTQYVRTPYQLFRLNLQLQDYWWGFHDACMIYWSDFSPFYGPQITLPGQFYMGAPIEDQLGIVPNLADNYPAPKVRARKSYWTGVSRRRRNL